jgi:hypothetical protein
VSLTSTVSQPLARPASEETIPKGGDDAAAVELLRLRDGSSVTVRAAGAANEPALLASTDVASARS